MQNNEVAYLAAMLRDETFYGPDVQDWAKRYLNDESTAEETEAMLDKILTIQQSLEGE